MEKIFLILRFPSIDGVPNDTHNLLRYVCFLSRLAPTVSRSELFPVVVLGLVYRTVVPGGEVLAGGVDGV